MAYLDYPAMVPSVIGDHGLFRLSYYGPLRHRMTMAYLDYPAMIPSGIDDQGLFRLSCYGPPQA